MIQLQKFTNLVNLLTYFKDEQICRKYLEAIRWGGNLKCAYKDCDSEKVFKFANGKVYKCAKCRRQYSVKVGTIFHDSKIPLQKWYAAIYLITAHKKGISSLQLHRDLGVTQKTAWYMLHRVRATLGINMSDKHLQYYIDEFVFRYNTRDLSGAVRFNTMLSNISTQLTYNQLINARTNRKLEAKQGAFKF